MYYVWVLLLLILLAGYLQNRMDDHLQFQIGLKEAPMVMRNQTASFRALQERVEIYRLAFVQRDYPTMYAMTYFRDTYKPTLIQFRNQRDTQYHYRIEVNTMEIEIQEGKGIARLELKLEHPALGRHKSIHTQEWQQIDELWYKVE
jgi:hypothetical protein